MFASRRLAPSVVLAVLSVGLSTAPAAQAAGTATTVYAGGAGFGDGGPAIDARLTLGSPGGQVTTDPQGRVVFADPAANEIRRIDADGTIERIAGNGDHAGAGPGYNGEGAGFSGDGGPATSAALAAPTGVQVASDGTIYIADTGNARIRKVAPDGNITTIAGTGTPGTSATTQDASTAAVEPTRLRLASNGDLYFTENTAGVADVRKIGGDGKVSLVAGNVAATSSSYDQSACASSQSVAVGHCFERVNDVAVAGDGTVYLADAASLVYQVSGNTLTTLSGAYHNYTNSGDGSTATSATLNYPYALALDASGHVLVATIGEIRSITPGGNITQDRALAPSLSGTSMSLSGTDLLVLDSGTLISVATDGTVTTLAGAATNGTGDGLPAADAVFAHIVGVAATPDGGTLVGDGVGRVWNVDAQGIAHRVAGSLAGQSTFAGEGGAATDAVLPGVSSVATAPDGSFYVGTADGAVRHVDLVGMITTVAGTGTLGNGADASAPATTVAIGHPYAMTATSGGTLYILDSDNNRLRALAGGNLTTVAGTGSAIGRAAVGQPMSALNLHGVTGLASAADGSLRITVSPNGDTPWLYDVSSAGTVTKAQRTSNAVPAVDPSGDTLVGAGYGMVRMFPDGSEEQLTSYDNVEQWAHPPVMGVGGDGAVWWARDSYPGMAGERLWKLSEPAASARPAAITGVAFHWDGNGPYVSWHAPAVGEQVIPVLRHGANAVAANPFDGFDLTYYTHSAIANTASVVFGEATDPIVQGEPFTVTLFPETVDGTVIGPPTVATYLLVPPTTCAIKPSVRTVPYGKSVAVTGTLTSLGSALAGEAATLSAQAVGKPSVVLKSTLTSSTGTVAASQVPVANTTYTFQHAVDNYAACAGSVVVTVAPTVTAVLAAATIHRGAHTTLTTTVGPNLSGQYVTLQHLVGTSWRTVSSLKLNRYSKAAWTVGSTTAGTFRYRVIKTADKYHAASISAVATLKVT